MTQSLEDYLESIYILTCRNTVARVKEISDMRTVKKPSVINALKELENRKYISHEKYGYIKLTAEGTKCAKDIFSRHVMLKKFLKDIIGVSEKTAEIDACSIEHYLNKESLEKIELFMGNFNKQSMEKL